MTAFYLGLALFLLLSLAAGMWRILRGPTAADRMLAAQLFGTTAVAILLLLAEAMGEPALRGVGLVFALLAGVTVVAFVRRAWPLAEEEHFDDAYPPQLSADNHGPLRVNAVDLKNVLRKININRDNFAHGRLLFPRGSWKPQLWHIAMRLGGSRSPHQKRSKLPTQN